MKWITSTTIKQWADTRSAQGLLPELILRLIRATSTNTSNIRFPNGDAVHLTGWDGVVESADAIFNISPGISLWECGVNANPLQKANEDYNKRTKDPLKYDKASATFVFVTPRIWDKATEWVQEKKQSKEWKDIVVITAVELEDWLSMCPAVALWLAEIISGRSIKKAYDIESYWNKWASGYNFKLKPSILLGGREKEQQTIYNRISTPSVTLIQSMAQSESLAFAVACILESPDKYNLLSKCIIVEDENALEQLIAEYRDIIFIAKVKHKSHIYATQYGHHVIYAASAAEVFNNASDTELLKLPLLDRDKFINSLVESGINKKRAEQLSQETVRNITILRRRLKLDFTCPEWAKPENIGDLIPAILVARWKDNIEGDKEIISLIANEKYDSYIKKLQKWTHQDDSPIINIDGKWRIYSPYEAFGYAARYITPNDFKNYKEAINRITSDNDPDAIEKMKATELRFWEFKQRYSDWIKEGLFQTAIMISLSEEKECLNLSVLPSQWIDSIIYNLLRNSPIEWWFSNKNILGTIAEASPKSYIEFIQKDVLEEHSIIKQLFTPKESADFLGPRENYVEILFSLQMLLWNEEWLLPVSCILAELCSIKNETNIGNKPIEALYEAYTLWCPQTYANTQQRLQILQTLSRKYPNQSFSLYCKLLNGLGYQTVICTHPMRWRCYNYTKANITYSELYDSIQRVCKLIVSACNNSEEQICKIIELAHQKSLYKECRAQLFNHVCKNKSAFKGNYEITNAIREIVHRHKIYSKQEWTLSKEEIHNWEVLLTELEPDNLVEKYRWIFKDYYIEIPEIERKRLEEEETIEQIYKYKNKILMEIEKTYGFNGIYSFTQTVGCPYEVGESYAYTATDEIYKKVLNLLLKEQESSIIDFSKGFFSYYTFHHGVKNVISIIKSLDINQYESILTIPLTVASCNCREIWDFIKTLSVSFQNEYWTNILIGLVHNEDAIFLIEKLNEYKRYDNAIEVISRSLKKNSIPTNLIEKTIIGYLSFPNKNSIYRTQYDLARIVLFLDKQGDANLQTLFYIELILYRLIKQYGNINETQFVKEIISNPYSMMNIIDEIYLSSDENKRKKELEQIEKHQEFKLLYYEILSELRQIPFVDKNSHIDIDKLNNYIHQLQELGKAKNKIEGVNTVIGELLGNYPETEDYPPLPICDIIENQNNTDIISGFKTRIYNKRGVTSRPALEGGSLEHKESQKYKKYADRVRYTHPIVCRIFDDLSNEYHHMAESEDKRVKIEKMEF